MEVPSGSTKLSTASYQLAQPQCFMLIMAAGLLTHQQPQQTACHTTLTRHVADIPCSATALWYPHHTALRFCILVPIQATPTLLARLPFRPLFRSCITYDLRLADFCRGPWSIKLKLSSFFV
jgi:hypothetical protein